MSEAARTGHCRVCGSPPPPQKKATRRLSGLKSERERKDRVTGRGFITDVKLRRLSRADIQERRRMLSKSKRGMTSSLGPCSLGQRRVCGREARAETFRLVLCAEI